MISGIRMPRLRCTRVSESGIRASWRYCACLLFTTVFVGCGTEALTNRWIPNKLPVMASFYTMHDFAQKIGGEHVQVTHAWCRPAQSPTTGEPSTKVILPGWSRRTFFIYNGAGMEHWVSTFWQGLSNKKIDFRGSVAGSEPAAQRRGRRDGLDHEAEEGQP